LKQLLDRGIARLRNTPHFYCNLSTKGSTSVAALPFVWMETSEKKSWQEVNRLVTKFSK